MSDLAEDFYLLERLGRNGDLVSLDAARRIKQQAARIEALEKQVAESELAMDCVCGGSAIVDWGGCHEYSSNCWQSVTVNCSDCDRDVDISIECEKDRSSEGGIVFERIVINAWNKLQREIQPPKGE